MARLDERDLDELESALSNLASNPRISPTYRGRLSDLQRAVGARRFTKRGQQPTGADLDRFELVMARLQIAVQAKKRDLELQVKQYDEREKRLEHLLDAIDERREERETARSAQGKRNASRRGNREETSATPQ
jgi:hypothetical protein